MTAKKPLVVAILDAIAVPAFWAVQQLIAVLDGLARFNPHIMVAGFAETVDRLHLRLNLIGGNR